MTTKKYALTESKYREVETHLKLLAKIVNEALYKWGNRECFPEELYLINYGYKALTSTLEDLDLL